MVGSDETAVAFGAALEALVDADYQWRRFWHAKTPAEWSAALTDLSNAMDSLRTWLPTYDYESGTVDWERMCEDGPNNPRGVWCCPEHEQEFRAKRATLSARSPK